MNRLVLVVPAPTAPSLMVLSPGLGHIGPVDLADRGPRSTETVLIVEDDPKLAALVARAFALDGRRTVVADTGDRALAAVRDDVTIGAVVLDIMIPHPDGIEVCNKLRRDGWAGTIVVVSASDSPHTHDYVWRAGADEFLAKPFGLAELVATVDALEPRRGPHLVIRDRRGRAGRPSGRPRAGLRWAPVRW